MQTDLAEGDLDFEAPFILPDTELVPVENNGETNFVAAGETVDEERGKKPSIRPTSP